MGDLLFTLSVGDSELLLAVTEFLHQINVENHSTNNWPNHRLAGFPVSRSISAGSVVAVILR